MNDTMKQQVRELLVKYPMLRNNSGELACSYKNIYKPEQSWLDFTRLKTESSITRISAMLQKSEPELRGSKWKERQDHARVFATKMRSQEKPENIPQINYIEDNRPFWKQLLGIN